MDSIVDNIMPHNNDDSDDDGGVHECDGVHAFEPLFCPRQCHMRVHVQSTLPPAAWLGHGLCLYGDDAGDDGTMNREHALAS